MSLPARQLAPEPAKPVSGHVPARPRSSSAAPAPLTLGVAGTYWVAERTLTLTEPAHADQAGQLVGQRTLRTQIWLPQRSADGRPARGPFPLILFAPGFLQCADTYADMLSAWAGAGYAVAAVNFPRTDCTVGAAADEFDVLNQPRDLSFVLTSLSTLSGRPGNALSGLLDPGKVAAAGQSDGAATVAALAANTCCTDGRLNAVAVLSGSEWPPVYGQYFTGEAPPMLFTQGSADTVNLPRNSLHLYQADPASARYYLDLLGATHLAPYTGTNPAEQVVVRVTLAFFDRYVLGQGDATATMSRDGNVYGSAVLVSGGQSPPQ